MHTAEPHKTWEGRSVSRQDWIDAMTSRGMRCQFDSECSASSSVGRWRDTGSVGIGEVELADQRLSPATHRGASLYEDDLFLKVVQHGAITIEQNDQLYSFGQGSIVLVDPSRAFIDHYQEQARLTLFRISKRALRERGMRDGFSEPWAPSVESVDLKAVRELLLYTGRQAETISERLLGRLAGQCLDLLDVAIDHSAESARGRNAAVAVFRAKQVIGRLIGDPELSVAKIAAELHLPASYLTRAFKENDLSPMRYAWTLRLQRAAQLLANVPAGTVQAKEVGYQCGFASSAHFSRAFKQCYGMSPIAFAALRNAAAASCDPGATALASLEPPECG